MTTCTIHVPINLVAVPAPSPGLCFGCHLYETNYGINLCADARPEEYIGNQTYCTVESIIWIRKEN